MYGIVPMIVPGVVTCGVTYGLGNANDLRAAQPDFLIDDLSQLSDYFW